MNELIIKKLCRNCKLADKCSNGNTNCLDFKVKTEIQELAKDNNNTIKIVEVQRMGETERSNAKANYLYNSHIKEGNKNIWRLTLLLQPTEWSEIKDYFQYFKNDMLVGWGTTSPVEVSEILVNLKGSDDVKDELLLIENEIANLETKQRWGYERDIEGRIDRANDTKKLKQLFKDKRELLGVI